MRGWISCAMLIGFASGASAGSASDSEQSAVTDVLRRYHAALATDDTERAAALLGPSLFMADVTSSNDEPRNRAHLFLTGDALQDWPSAYLSEAGPHQNEFEVISVSVRGDAAVARTWDTGRNRFRNWEREEVTWFLGRVDDGWRIVAMIVTDIQLPEREP